MTDLSNAKKHDLMRMQIMKQLLKSAELTETVHGLLDLRSSRSGRKPSVKKVAPKVEVRPTKAETIEFPKPKSDLERLADRLEAVERKLAVNEFKQRKEVA